MELRLLGARGVREGSLLSIKVGAKRCFVPYHSDNIGDGLCKFPSLSGGPEQVKLDVYEPVAHARLIVEPTDVRWNVGLAPRASIFAQEEDDSRSCTGRTPDGSFLSAGEQQPMSLEFEARSVSGAQPRAATAGEDELGASPQVSTRGSGRAEHRHQADIAASKSQPYADKHNLLKVLQTLLKSVMAEKPADPFAYMVQALQNRAYADVGKKARPQSALVRGSPPLQASQAQRPSSATQQPQCAITRVRPAQQLPVRPALGPLAGVARASLPPSRLSPKSPSAPLAPGVRAVHPDEHPSVPVLNGRPDTAEGSSSPSCAAAAVAAAGAARNAVPRVRTPARTQSAPSLAPPLAGLPAAGPLHRAGEVGERQEPPVEAFGPGPPKPPRRGKLADEPELQNTASSQSTASQAQRGSEENDLEEEEDRLPQDWGSPGSEAGLTDVMSIPDAMAVAAGVVSRECRERLQAIPWGA